MNHADYIEITEALRTDMAARLSIRAKSFPKAVRKAGRLLPSSARTAAQDLIAVEQRFANPKLAARTDPAHATRAAETVQAALHRHRAGVRAGQQRSLLMAEIGFRALVVIGAGLALLQMQSPV